MRQMVKERIRYKYTEEFIEKSKKRRKLEYFILIIGGGTLGITRIYLRQFSILSLLFLTVYLIWVFGYSTIIRLYNRDHIYVEDDIIHFNKVFNYRMRPGYRSESVNNIKKLVITDNWIIIYGKVISSKDGITRIHRSMKIPKGIENYEQFIGFVESKIKEADEASIYDKKDESPKGQKVSRRDAWRCIREPFLHLTRKYLPIAILSFLVFCICSYIGFYLKIQIVFIMIIWLAAEVIAFVTFMLYMLNICKDYLPDLIFKSARVYRGYINGIGRPSRWNRTPYFISQYYDYYIMQMVYKKGYRPPATPQAVGDLKRNPIGGRTFLMENMDMLKGIPQNKEIEVIYFKYSKLVLSVKEVI